MHMKLILFYCIDASKLYLMLMRLTSPKSSSGLYVTCILKLNVDGTRILCETHLNMKFAYRINVCMHSTLEFEVHYLFEMVF